MGGDSRALDRRARQQSGRDDHRGASAVQAWRRFHQAGRQHVGRYADHCARGTGDHCPGSTPTPGSRDHSLARRGLDARRGQGGARLDPARGSRHQRGSRGGRGSRRAPHADHDLSAASPGAWSRGRARLTRGRRDQAQLGWRRLRPRARESSGHHHPVRHGHRQFPPDALRSAACARSRDPRAVWGLHAPAGHFRLHARQRAGDGPPAGRGECWRQAASPTSCCSTAIPLPTSACCKVVTISPWSSRMGEWWVRVASRTPSRRWPWPRRRRHEVP